MNAARMWKLVSAGLIAAALLAAVPAESQASTAASAHSPAGSISARATSRPVVPSGAVKAALATGPTCNCPNEGEVEYAMKELGIKSFTRSLFVKRLGKVPGNDVYATLLLSLNKKAPALKKKIPFPAFNSTTAKKYAKSPYRVYEIFGVSKGPVTVHETWKYGITRQMIAAQRPQRQLTNCTKYFGSSTLITGKCTYQWLWIGTGWLQARGLEASYTLLYALRNAGNCPPGMPACI